MTKRRIQIGFMAMISLLAVSCSSDDSSTPVDPVINPPISLTYSDVTKVFEYAPAYGQFVNVFPAYSEGDTQEIMNQKAMVAISGKQPNLISLGGFGGYVVVGFDKTIQNVTGKRDFMVLANAFANSSEPGIIMVAQDKNGNGKPDDNEWFEIAGSEHLNPKTINNYEITYYRPDANKVPVTDSLLKWVTDVQYIKWSDNHGNKGWKAKNVYHAQSYFPNWIKEDKITFSGTLLPNNGIDTNGQGTMWHLKEFEWGYVDNFPNGHNESAIDISWAVDREGNKVNLKGIDFIKIYTGMNQETGWLGETSTEVMGIIDLHKAKITIPTKN